MTSHYDDPAETDIAIIGMAGRFPGADSPDELWKKIAAGEELISFFSDDELLNSGVDKRVLREPGYVNASPVLKDPSRFDALFFGYSPREAATMDPQQRLFLECAAAALERAGYDPDRYEGPIGVFASEAMNTYLLQGAVTNRFFEEYLPTLLTNDKDFLATRVSYKLNLTGPSMTIQTACSTSLVRDLPPARASSPKSATWRLPAACRSLAPAPATSISPEASSPRTAPAGRSTPRRRARSSAAAPASSCSSASARPSRTATPSSP